MTTTLLSGYRGRKVHAVDPDRYRHLHAEGQGLSLCGWGVTVSDLEFKDLGEITCRTCAAAAARQGA